MSLEIFLDCPKCKNKIKVDILACKEGTEIMCPNCETMIKLHFEGDTPKQVIDKIKKDIEKQLRKISKNIKLRF